MRVQACFGETPLNLTMGGRLAMVLRLADGEGQPAICPLHHGIQPDIVVEEIIGRDPALKVAQRCGVAELNLPPESGYGGILAQIGARCGDDHWD